MKILFNYISAGNYIFWHHGNQYIIAKVIDGTIYRVSHNALHVDGLILEDTRVMSCIGQIFSFTISQCEFFTKRSDIDKVLIFT